MDLHPKQFVRVNVTADRGICLRRSFSVDPRTITLDRLRHLIARALDIRHEFSIVALLGNGGGALPLSCDWDLEGALGDEPRIDLRLELHTLEPGFEEWDIICPADVPVAGHEAYCCTTLQTRKGSFLDQVLLHIRAPLLLSSPHLHLSEAEFCELADWPGPLRYAVFRCDGARDEVRPLLWPHLLDVYPAGAGEEQRREFLNRKAEEYYKLRHAWQRLVQAGTIPPVLQDVTNLIRKDVRRTDRAQELDERALYNVLTTYALHHPSTGYCQGMSDLLSPLMRVMRTEPLSYVAFCGLMRRMRGNFRRDGRSVRTKFRHLRRALRAHDPELHAHLGEVGALDLLFCYRWLLLDLKREFPYEEMMRATEVLWSTLRPIETERGVELYEERFPAPSICDALREVDNPEDRLTFEEHHFGTPGGGDRRWTVPSDRQNSNNESGESSTEDEDGGILHYRRTRRTRSVCRSWSGRGLERRHRDTSQPNTVHEIQIDRWLNDDSWRDARRRHGSSDSNYEYNFSEEEEGDEEPPSRGRSEGYTSGQEEDEESSSSSCSSPDNSFDSADAYFRRDHRHLPLLPPPTRLGDGKPFLIFLCLVMMIGQRDVILTCKMDANEIGIHFDKMVRRHRLADVLRIAKEMFAEYLRTGWTDDDDDD